MEPVIQSGPGAEEFAIAEQSSFNRTFIINSPLSAETKFSVNVG